MMNIQKKEDERRVILEVTDVIKQYKQYDAVVTAVNRASFKIYEGEFVAIIGASGSGKSTLLHLCVSAESRKVMFSAKISGGFLHGIQIGTATLADPVFIHQIHRRAVLLRQRYGTLPRKMEDAVTAD